MPVQEAEVIPLRPREPGAPETPPRRLAPVIELRPRPESLASTFAGFVRNRLTGDYPVDDFGFDPQLTDAVIMPPLRLMYEKWFRVEVTGAENLPVDGGALVVANHSGTLPWDAVMTAIAVHDNHPRGKHLRMLGADLVFRVPVLSTLARRTGQTLACGADAERLLRSGELVGVWPEGFKGIGKPFSERYRLQRFGRGGFARTAMRAGVPIIPCSIVGAEEIYPKIADLKPVAKLLGLPYFPVTPFFPLLGPLGAVPLPTKWHIDFGTPVRTDLATPDETDDHGAALETAEHVRDTVQQTLDGMVAGRRSVFRG
ncbi:lysophospholipid acyltransferase family protein [Actinophytocola sp.]|uniref:lysophospholipid acyltransferase family protein n=1 Tax=Actinophytocola sp. TaxID=1872138 RepID=UPI002D253B84|nr:lysophospholipid acyltransferase family protein [Actinophytocola sp.]HYQ65661.1 lysophospholipid acyltransferase family protein [Actinophytocola sp.]